MLGFVRVFRFALGLGMGFLRRGRGLGPGAVACRTLQGTERVLTLTLSP